MTLHDVAGAAVQVARPVVVAEAGPRGQHLLLRRFGQGVDVREAGEERLVVGLDGLHRRLLQHDLGDPDRDTGRRSAPGQVAAMAAIPGEQAAAQGGRPVIERIV